jgi:hypothetical protein
MLKRTVFLSVLLIALSSSLWGAVAPDTGRQIEFGDSIEVVVFVFVENGQPMWVVMCRLENGWFIYCSNNPLVFVDPSGLRSGKRVDEVIEPSEPTKTPEPEKEPTTIYDFKPP